MAIPHVTNEPYTTTFGAAGPASPFNVEKRLIRDNPKADKARHRGGSLLLACCCQRAII